MKVINASYIIDCPESPIDMLRRLERYARKCYQSEDKITDISYVTMIKKVMAKGHLSVLDHAFVSVVFIMNRGISHELVRHRIGGYSQESTRWCSYNKDKFGGEISFIPNLDGLTEVQIQRRLNFYKQVEDLYLTELSEGIKPQQARDNLVICLKTEIVATYDLTEWRNVFSKRTALDAHPQMRELMVPLLQDFKDLIPIVFDDIGGNSD